jgi:hypothetical protein
MVKPSYRLTKRARIARMAWRGGHPLVVFSVPKSASSTVADALRHAAADRPVFQIHLLSPERVANSERKYRETDPDARMLHIWQSEYLWRHLPTVDAPWDVVTLVRDPVAQLVSQFFQAAHGLGPGSDAVALARSVEAFVDQRLPATLGWFDLELEPHVGIDVYAHPFDPTVAHAAIETPRARVLLLRTESLSRSSSALGAFLDTAPIPLGRENSADRKQYADLYRAVLDEIDLASKTLDRAYSSKLVRHFYAPEEIQAFRRSWDRGADTARDPAARAR